MMNRTITASILATTAIALATPVHADPNAVKAEAEATYKDIKQTLGFVPGFFRAFPDEGIAAAWDELKSVQLNPDTALDGKTKELIGLAVAAQIPCKYCIYFHTQISTLDGASEQEQEEAVAMAAITRHWSTVLNGLEISLPEFKQEVTKIMAYVQHPTATGSADAVTDSATAYKDIERTLGSVPTFLKKFPKVGVAAAWRELKSVQLNPDTALSGKTKELIGLAVAAQIPCQYCIYFHTEAAKLNGASDEEIAEAVTMAALTRHWSTVLNGNEVDEKAFRKDVDHVVRNVKAAAKAK